MIARVQWLLVALRILAVAGGAYALGVAALFLLQDRLIYPAPRGGAREPRDAGIADAERFDVTASDGVRLHGWILFPRGERRALPALLTFHGNAENVTLDADLLDALRREGLLVAAIDYRGYGLSEGSPSEKGLIDDGLSALRALRARPEVDPRRIVLHGRSLGSAVAVAVAAESPVAGVVIESGFDSLRRVAARSLPLVPSILVRSPFDSAARIGRVRCPILFLHGDADALVPIASGRALAACAPGTPTFHAVAGAGHNDLIPLCSDYDRRIAEFVRGVAPVDAAER